MAETSSNPVDNGCSGSSLDIRGTHRGSIRPTSDSFHTGSIVDTPLPTNVYADGSSPLWEAGFQAARADAESITAERTTAFLPAHRKGQAQRAKADEALTKAAAYVALVASLLVWSAREVRRALLHRGLRKPL